MNPLMEDKNIYPFEQKKNEWRQLKVNEFKNALSDLSKIASGLNTRESVNKNDAIFREFKKENVKEILIDLTLNLDKPEPIYQLHDPERTGNILEQYKVKISDLDLMSILIYEAVFFDISPVPGLPCDEIGKGYMDLKEKYINNSDEIFIDEKAFIERIRQDFGRAINKDIDDRKSQGLAPNIMLESEPSIQLKPYLTAVSQDKDNNPAMKEKKDVEQKFVNFLNNSFIQNLEEYTRHLISKLEKLNKKSGYDKSSNKYKSLKTRLKEASDIFIYIDNIRTLHNIPTELLNVKEISKTLSQKINEIQTNRLNNSKPNFFKKKVELGTLKYLEDSLKNNYNRLVTSVSQIESPSSKKPSK